MVSGTISSLQVQSRTALPLRLWSRIQKEHISLGLLSVQMSDKRQQHWPNTGAATLLIVSTQGVGERQLTRCCQQVLPYQLLATGIFWGVVASQGRQH